MHATGLIQTVVGLMGRRGRTEFGVRYTPERAYCGVPGDAAVQYRGDALVCRNCHGSKNEDGF